MIWVFAAVGSAFVNLAVSELVGWLPWLAERIVRWSARLLPREARRRYEDEWLAELEVLPGSGISALIFALRIRLRTEENSSYWPFARRGAHDPFVTVPGFRSKRILHSLDAYSDAPRLTSYHNSSMYCAAT